MLEVLAFETPSLGDRSYLITDGTTAAVIDPQRDVDRFLTAAEQRGARIVCVAETHVHNDYLTGGPALAARTGAYYVVPVADGVRTEHHEVGDGDEGDCGGFALGAFATPGHTPRHLAFLLRDAGGAGKVTGVFTGGSLLYGTVGRTDLSGRDLTEPLARAQHKSVRRLLEALPPDAVVYPTHGFGSHCSASRSDLGSGTIADERLRNPAANLAEEPFVKELLAGFHPYPSYYAYMGELNREGPPPLLLGEPRELKVDDLIRRIGRGEWVIDLRSRSQFGAGHLPGAVNAELGDRLPGHVGWVLPWGTPFVLLADRPEDIAAAQLMLARIGYEKVAGAATTGWRQHASGILRSADFPALDAVRGGAASRSPLVVLDVRDEWEYAESHLDAAINVPFHELPGRFTEVPPGQVWVHCATGARASLAASLLAREGRDVVLVDDTFADMADSSNG